MQTFQTDGPVTVVVRTGGGHVSISAQDTPDSTVELTALSSAGEEAASVALVELNRGVLLVDVPRRGPGLFRGGPQVAVQITCPTGSSLQVRAESADVRAVGSYATADLVSGSGDLTVETVTGTAKLKTGSGSVVTGQVGTLVVTTGSGDVEVGVLEGSLLTRSGSGDLVVRRAASGTVRATGASGQVSIGIQDGTAAWLDLSTVSGRVTQELGETDAPGEDQQRVEITARTVSGDLRVHRS